jgi:D-beta-D-heptose 7-phosphate kinase/D-beta-D-heptose 1-phosphate adenosyltransferase
MTVVFTNGCFDILHRGHLEYLKASKNLGDKLIVGINSDASVRLLKGSDRPINKQEDRKALLLALKFVDEVIIFDDITPYFLIKEIQPDIITKGGDYEPYKVVGANLAKVVIIPFITGYSTTGLINAIQR